MNEWISVEERLPQDLKVVIVHGGVGYQHNGTWYTITGEEWPGKRIHWDVTHWMPLPEPPKETP